MKYQKLNNLCLNIQMATFTEINSDTLVQIKDLQGDTLVIITDIIPKLDIYNELVEHISCSDKIINLTLVINNNDNMILRIDWRSPQNIYLSGITSIVRRNKHLKSLYFDNDCMMDNNTSLDFWNAVNNSNIHSVRLTYFMLSYDIAVLKDNSNLCSIIIDDNSGVSENIKLNLLDKILNRNTSRKCAIILSSYTKKSSTITGYRDMLRLICKYIKHQSGLTIILK